MKNIMTILFCLISCALALGKNQDYLFFSPEMISSHIKEYSPEEKELILKDLDVVRSVCSSLQENTLIQKPLYIATAGAPGTRKTTILERFMNHYVLTSHMTYLDPDQRALKFMSHTYYNKSLSAYSIALQKEYANAVQEAYEKWRGASNYITLTLLEEAFAECKNIAHGTTSTGGHIDSFLSAIKKANYEIILLLCSAEDSFRGNAIEYRNTEQKFYQSTPEDAISKGKIFPTRMQSYFTYADSLYIFWSNDLFEQESLAAIFSHGTLKILDSNALNFFIDQFEKDRALLMQKGTQIPSWEELLKIYQERFPLSILPRKTERKHRNKQIP